MSPGLPGALESVAFDLVEAITRKDRYTGGHAKRVAHYAVTIASALEGRALTDAELSRVRIAAILHDVGKIDIEDHILKKPAPLDEDELRVMRTHPRLGLEALDRLRELGEESAPLMEAVLFAMRCHHERWDGQGYPLGISGQGIPLVARIVAVADAYDAMVSTRPYRAGIGAQAAREQIARGSGTQFDPEIVDAFARSIACRGM